MTIDIKLNPSPSYTKGFLQVIDDNRTETNFLITPGNDSYPVHERIEVQGVERFLEGLDKGLR